MIMVVREFGKLKMMNIIAMVDEDNYVQINT